MIKVRFIKTRKIHGIFFTGDKEEIDFAKAIAVYKLTPAEYFMRKYCFKALPLKTSEYEVKDAAVEK